jgi:hypothetical protein
MEEVRVVGTAHLVASLIIHFMVSDSGFGRVHASGTAVLRPTRNWPARPQGTDVLHPPSSGSESLGNDDVLG